MCRYGQTIKRIQMLHFKAIEPGTLSLLISYESETPVSFKNQTLAGIKKA
jgi:hypothetical protein